MSDSTLDPAAAPSALLDQIDAHTRKVDIDTTAITPSSAYVVERLRNDERVEVRALERHLPAPLRPRGHAVLHEWQDFADIVTRLHDTHGTALYADVDKNTVVAVFDDHGEDGLAGWRQHRASLALKPDVDWTAWLGADGKYLPQETFAELLEDLAHTIVTPDAATLIEVATGFRATTKAEFSRAVRLDNGNVEMKYSEDTTATAGKASGTLEIPSSFTVRIAPWRGVDPVDLTARFRYRLNHGQLGLGYALLRPDRARDDAFALILRRIREEIPEELPLVKGSAPEPVAPALDT